MVQVVKALLANWNNGVHLGDEKFLIIFNVSTKCARMCCDEYGIHSSSKMLICLCSLRYSISTRGVLCCEASLTPQHILAHICSKLVISMFSLYPFKCNK